MVEESVLLDPSTNYSESKKQNFETVEIDLKKFREEILSELIQQRVDIVLGAPFSELSPQDLPKSYKLKSSNILSVTWAFLNMNRPSLQDPEVRSIIRSQFELTKADRRVFSEFEKPLKNLFRSEILREHESSTLSNGTKKKPQAPSQLPPSLHVVIPMGFTTDAFDSLLISNFRKIGVEVTIEKAKGLQLWTLSQQGQFDIFVLPYAGLYGDPDGYLDALHPDGLMKASKLMSHELVAAFSENRFIEPTEKRINAYRDAILRFQELNQIIPIAQQALPFIVRDNIEVGTTDLRQFIDLTEAVRR